jgi:hypothetical protein
MVGIWAHPDLDAIEQWIDETTAQLAQEFVETTGISESVFNRVNTRTVLISGKFGRGTGEPGNDPLEPVFIVDVEGDKTSETEVYEEVVVPLLQTFEDDDVWRGLMVDTPPQSMLNWFTGIEMFNSIWPSDKSEDAINFHIQREEPHRVFDLTTRDIIESQEVVPDEEEFGRLELQQMLSPDEFAEFQGGTPLSELMEGEVKPSRIPLGEFLEGEEDVEEEPDTEPDKELGESEKKYERKDEFLEDMPAVLTPFAERSDSLEVPAGKVTKEVTPRDLYKFEAAMGHESPDMPADEPELQDFREGVGFHIAMGNVGQTVAASNFPRTALYIKNRLFYEGPAYILQIYNDFVLYSGYISSLHQMEFRPGRYNSFRNFIGRLYRYGEEKGPRLVERISAPEAAEMGFELTPDHPTIEGEKAPWLEDRQYYRIVEDNMDSEVWHNVTEFLYEEE